VISRNIFDFEVFYIIEFNLRLWSIHPEFLDVKGLSALWREALLAQAVLLKRTKGWRNHPQLTRFKDHSNPISAISYYLLVIHKESEKRNFNFQKSKINMPVESVEKIDLTDGQLSYEAEILLERLKRRSPDSYVKLLKLGEYKRFPEPHPIFKIIEGEVERWEKSYWRKKI